MLKQSRYLSAVLSFTLTMVGCSGDQYVTDAPPRSAKDAEKWWAETLDRLDPDFLAVLCVASEVHRQNSTTATYISSFSGRTMVGWYHHELRLPLPLSDAAIAKARARLVGWTPSGEQPTYRSGMSWSHWESGKGCSDQRAAEIWQEAEKKCGWSRAASNAAEQGATANRPRE
jgi:hypothetical protein